MQKTEDKAYIVMLYLFAAVIVILLFCLMLNSAGAQQVNPHSPLPLTWKVPADFSTIQGAIIHARDGESVLVAPGTYTERLNYLGKAIEVRSEKGPEATVIDGGQMGSVVSFINNEREESVLKGFTIQNGSGTAWTDSLGAHRVGGGIFCGLAGPTIQNCIIQDNSVYTGTLNEQAHGGGMGCTCVLPETKIWQGGDNDWIPTVEDCHFLRNKANRGGGLYIRFDSYKAYGRYRVRDCYFGENQSLINGNALYLWCGSGDIRNIEAVDNDSCG